MVLLFRECFENCACSENILRAVCVLGKFQELAAVGKVTRTELWSAKEANGRVCSKGVATRIGKRWKYDEHTMDGTAHGIWRADDKKKVSEKENGLVKRAMSEERKRIRDFVM